ncbi:hypothetical protein ODS41_07640 [Pyrobaculum sp. 3827-6]|uniref:hypothetical protein n=1 Tax=Pyrobaculum sp. 3827-6 TaxID=2983604 RepID=UPI0021D9913D|nr:hypothetical protein [Pyrobaculum sp. 3827-6]MCU7787783.1 hypothetical protein [Pyrobaculum sp. 3827-6]
MSGELGALAQEALRVAVESVLGKLREGKKLSTEDIFLLYLATIGKELDEIRREIAEVNQRIDQTNRRIDTIAQELGRRIDETNKRIDAIAQELGRRIDETNKRIDGVYALLLDIQKLLVEIARKS